MAITASCPNGHSFPVRDDLAGKKVRCPQCSAVSVVGGGAAAGGTAKPAKGKAAGKDPWDLDDPFEGEEAAPKKSAAAPARGGGAPAKSGGRKKRSSKSSGSSFPIGAMLGGLAGLAVLGGGVWFWLGRTPAAVEAPPVAAAPAAPASPPASPAAIAALPTGAPLPAAGTAPMNPPGAATAPAPMVSAADAALGQQVAGYAFPPMTDPGYGPPPPEGLVVSRAMVNALTEMITTMARANGSPGAPPDLMVQNVVLNVGKQRKEDPALYCLPAALEESLLAGTADLAAIRRDFDRTMVEIGPAGAELPAMVLMQMDPYQKNQLSPTRIVFLTKVLEAKIRKVKAGGIANAAPPAPAAPPALAAPSSDGAAPPMTPAPVTAPAAAPATAPMAILDQTKTVPAGLEWNREMKFKRPGTMRFRVTSTQKFSVLIVTDKAFQGIQNNRRDQVTKMELLFDADPRTEPLEQVVELPAGSVWIMIKNESKAEGETRLECFPE